MSQVCVSQLQLKRPGELQEARDQRIGAVHFGADEAGHFARHFVFRDELFAQHFGGCLDGAERVAQLVRQARGELAQSGQAVRPAHGFLGPLQVHVGFGKLLRRAAVLFRLDAQIFGQRVRQVPRHGEENHARHQLADILPFHGEFGPIDGHQEREIRSARRDREQQGANHSESSSRGDHRQHQHQPEMAFYGTGKPDHHISEHQF